MGKIALSKYYLRIISFYKYFKSTIQEYDHATNRMKSML